MRVLTIDTSRPTPIYLQIIDQIRSGVREGILTPHSPLPSVRQLATDLEINPNTVAKAYMLLEREGMIRTVRRRGSFIADGAPARARESADERLNETLERVLAETETLGIDRRDVLEALRRKLDEAGPREEPTSGGTTG